MPSERENDERSSGILQKLDNIIIESLNDANTNFWTTLISEDAVYRKREREGGRCYKIYYLSPRMCAGALHTRDIVGIQLT